MTATLALIVVWVAIACMGDVCFKAARSWTDPNFIWGLTLYICTGGIAVLTFRRADFGSVAIIWIATSLLLSLATSVFYYHEHLSLARIVAAVLTLLAVILAKD